MERFYAMDNFFSGNIKYNLMEMSQHIHFLLINFFYQPNIIYIKLLKKGLWKCGPETILSQPFGSIGYRCRP